MYELRDYQQRCVDDILEAMEQNATLKTVAVQPCGAGKSLIIAKLCELLDEPILVLQPSKELLEQNYNKFIAFGGEASIYSASKGQKELGHVTFATHGSVKKLGKTFRSMGVKVVIMDECDASSKTNGVINKMFKELKPAHIIGLTATPINLHTNVESGTTIRMINTYHKNLFKDICHVTQVSELVEQGYWSQVLVERVASDDSMLELNTTGVEYTDHSMFEFYEDNKLQSKIIEQMELGFSSGRKHCLIFVPSIDQAEDLAKVDSRIRVVSALTPKREREDIVEGFKVGVISTVACVQTMAVGFDFPELDFVIMARPTASYRVYYQAYGRSVRLHSNKKNCLLVDLTNNTEKFGRPEDMTYENLNGYGWGMFLGEYLMTNVSLKHGLKVQKKHLYKQPVPEGCLWFGKHKGQKIVDIPNEYLDWVLSVKDFNWAGEKDKKKIERIKEEILVKLGTKNTTKKFVN